MEAAGCPAYIEKKLAAMRVASHDQFTGNIAPFSHTARTPNEIVREIASSKLDPSTVTHLEERMFLAWCRQIAGQHLDKIERHVARGAFRKAHQAAFAFRVCLAARYLALWRSKPTSLADSPFLSIDERARRRSERLRAILSLLQRVANFGEAARADVFAKRKRTSTGRLTDERRILFCFSWLDRARQRLIAESIKPLASLHPRQYLLRREGGRGRSAVCEYLRRELPRVPADYVFVQLDVRNFFGSISPEWMESRLGLPSAIVCRQVHTGEMTLRTMRSVRAHLSGGELERMIRRVLPQGSALASLVAEMAMAEVLGGLADRLPAYVRLIVYSDNLGILVPGAEAAAVEDLFRRAFASAGAGSFVIHGDPPAPLTGDFRFLGHWWRLRDGSASVYVPAEKAAARAAQITLDLLTAAPAELRRMRHRVLAQAHEWSLWPGVAAWKSDILAQIERAEMDVVLSRAA